MRLLLCIAAPEDLDPERGRLDFEHEEELLFTALDRPLSRGEVEIDVTEDGVLTTLLTRLEAQRYHAVILSMHDTQAQNSQGVAEWGLLFEDAQTGRQAPVAGSDLAAHFDCLPRGHRPGLTILAACRSARADKSVAALGSVAALLHSRGCERVLGDKTIVAGPAGYAPFLLWAASILALLRVVLPQQYATGRHEPASWRHAVLQAQRRKYRWLQIGAWLFILGILAAVYPLVK